jgi:hypothetical protein
VMAILRLAPGDEAPWEGSYALVAEWGESLGFAVWRNKGERLPLTTVAEAGPVWYVLVGDHVPSEAAQAA